MLDSPIALLLLGISAASALASYTAHRRRRRTRPAPPALSALSDADLLAALASLEPHPTNAQTTAQLRARRAALHSISAMHSASEIRDAHHPVSASWAEHDREVHRRITLLLVEEIERRGLSPAWFK